MPWFEEHRQVPEQCLLLTWVWFSVLPAPLPHLFTPLLCPFPLFPLPHLPLALPPPHSPAVPPPLSIPFLGASSSSWAPEMMEKPIIAVETRAATMYHKDRCIVLHRRGYSYRNLSLMVWLKTSLPIATRAAALPVPPVRLLLSRARPRPPTHLPGAQARPGRGWAGGSLPAFSLARRSGQLEIANSARSFATSTVTRDVRHRRYGSRG